MNLSKLCLVLAIGMSAPNAIARCTTGDLFGEWHLIGAGAEGEGIVCTLYFNAVGKLKTASNCTSFNDTTPDRVPFDLDPASQLSVNGRCRVTGSIGGLGESPLSTFDGQMSRDGEYIQGTVETNLPDDMGSEVVTAVKVD